MVHSQAEDHQEHLACVFDELKNHGLKLKPSKCHMKVPSVELPGYIVSVEGFACNPDETRAFAEQGPPVK